MPASHSEVRTGAGEDGTDIGRGVEMEGGVYMEQDLETVGLGTETGVDAETKGERVDVGIIGLDKEIDVEIGYQVGTKQGTETELDVEVG